MIAFIPHIWCYNLDFDILIKDLYNYINFIQFFLLNLSHLCLCTSITLSLVFLFSAFNSCDLSLDMPIKVPLEVHFLFDHFYKNCLKPNKGPDP